VPSQKLGYFVRLAEIPTPEGATQGIEHSWSKNWIY